MKKLLVSVAAAALLSSPVATPHFPLAGVPAAHAQAQVSMGVFFDSLGEHGSWVSHPRHRYVWVPTAVDAGWVPYSNGRWVYTDQFGWYFVSDEPFAWAVYHYGRWAYERDIGWYWVPGTRWAPAWVSWRRGDDYLGWAPLPPEGDGYIVSVEVSTEPPPGYWVFVPVRQFTAPDLAVVIVDRAEIPVLYERTEMLGPVVVENDVVINNIIDIDYIQENTDQEVTVTEVQVVDDPAQAAQSDAPVAFQGEIAVEDEAAPPEPVEAAQVEAPTAGQEIESDDPAASTGEEAPTGEAPAEATEGTPAEETPSETAPTDEQPVDEAPADEQPVEEAPAEEQPADQTPAEEQPAEEATPEDAAPAEQAPAEEQPAGEAPAEEQPAEPTPEEAAPVEGAPAEEQPADEAPAEQQPAEEAAPEETAPAEQPPAQEAPAEECPPAAREAGQC